MVTKEISKDLKNNCIDYFHVSHKLCQHMPTARIGRKFISNVLQKPTYAKKKTKMTVKVNFLD